MNAGLYQRRRRHIGLTALIDVVFILLLFFMLSSTFTRWRTVDFESPLAGSSDTAQEPQIVLLDESGALKLHDSDFSISGIDQLDAADANLFEAGQALVLLAAADTSVQTIVLAIEGLNEIGLQHVIFAGALPGETD